MEGVAMSLNKIQWDFTKCVARLLLRMEEDGYDVSFGDAYRDPRAPYGHPNSAHKKRLAIDLNLFKDGAYLSLTEDHAEFGEYWKTLHPLARWGGDFEDGNHYSFEHEGVK
jgi:hypothetical protein